MNELSSHHSPGPRLSAWIVIVMLTMIVVPAAITLETVRSPAKLEMANSDPTPHGYTWSPPLFLFPTAVIAFGFLPREEVKLPRLKLTGTGSQGGKTRFDAR
jgi:hypothetical protein